jgi:hypothetical protein
MISAGHDATIVDRGRKGRKRNMEIKKPCAVVQCNKLVKGVDRAEQYLSYYSFLRKTVKWHCICYTVHCLVHFVCTGHEINSNN